MNMLKSVYEGIPRIFRFFLSLLKSQARYVHRPAADHFAFSVTFVLLNVVLEWLAFLLHMWAVLESSLGLETGYLD